LKPFKGVKRLDRGASNAGPNPGMRAQSHLVRYIVGGDLNDAR